MEIFNCVEYIESEQLSDYAAAAARLIRADSSLRCSSALPALRQSYEEIRRCRARLAKRSGDLASPPAASSKSGISPQEPA